MTARKSAERAARGGASGAARASGSSRASGAGRVDELLAARAHPLGSAIAPLRRAILGASGEVEERWKWNAPSYHVRGMDLAAFNLRDDGEVMLVLLFAHGLIEGAGLALEGAWKDRRILRFADARDARAAAPALARLVRAMAERVPA